jgi:hypothetical protein
MALDRGAEMTVYEMTIAKIQQMPESLIQEVHDFVDLLLTRSDRARWQMWQQFSESLALAEADLPDYLPNLQEYEERLARGEVQW